MITSYFKAKKKESSLDNDDTKAATSSPPSITAITNTMKGDSSKHTLVTPTDENKSSSKRMKYASNETTSVISNAPLSIESTNTKLSNISCDATKELLSHLTDDSWRIKLANYVTKPSFMRLAKFVANER